MKLLSLDTSTKNSGFAVYLDGKLNRFSSIDLSHINDTWNRMNQMISSLYELIEEEHPDYIVIEQTAVARNPHTQRLLTMILGAVYGECVKLGISYYSLTPNEWRKAVKYEDEKLPRKGEELKVWGIDVVKKLYGIDIINDNVSDAILIGRAFLNREKKE